VTDELKDVKGAVGIVDLSAPVDPALTAQILGHEGFEGLASNEVGREIPVHRHQRVLGSKGIAASHGEGLIAPAKESGPRDETLTKEFPYPILKGAAKGHEIVELAKILFGEIEGLGGFWAPSDAKAIDRQVAVSKIPEIVEMV
jgi:hypothetical protein